MSDKEEERPLPPFKKRKFKAMRTDVVKEKEDDVIDVDETYTSCIITSSASEKPTCPHCSKTFLTVKSLHGHMRVHPDRHFRGVSPPKKSVIDSDDQVAINASSGSKSNCSAAAVAASCSSVDNDETEEESVMEAAFALMLLATGDEFYRTLPTRSEKDAVRVSEVSKKKTNLDDNGGCSSAEGKKREMENGGAIKCSKKRTTGENDGRTSYKCSTCDRCFGSPQALGRHTSSAHPTKTVIKSGRKKVLSVDLDESPKAVGTSYVCEMCKMEFQTRRALGGHKRIHYNKPPVADTVADAVAVAVEDEPVVNCFDLNQPPADDS